MKGMTKVYLMVIFSTLIFNSVLGKTGSYTFRFTQPQAPVGTLVRITAKDAGGRTYDETFSVEGMTEEQARDLIKADLADANWIVENSGTNGIIIRRGPLSDITQVDGGDNRTEVTVGLGGNVKIVEAIPGDKKFKFGCALPNSDNIEPGSLVVNINHHRIYTMLDPDATPEECAVKLEYKMTLIGFVVTRTETEVTLDWENPVNYGMIGDSVYIEMALENGASGPHIQLSLPQSIPPPIISRLEPISGEQGKTIELAILGDEFIDGALVGFSPATGITVASISFIGSTELRAVIDIAIDAPLGYRDVIVTNLDEQSDTLEGGFTVVTAPPLGWTQLDTVPTRPGKVGIKDGGALVAKGCSLYAFQGGNSRYFFVYDYTTGSWYERESIPYKLKPNGRPDNKKVKAGGALVAHGCTIYAFKGGNTNEFWAYLPGKDSWIEKCSIPQVAPGATKKTKVKAGGALVAHACSLYAFKGGNTNEFWVYSTADDVWYPRDSLGTPDHKRIKGGGALVAKGCTIYAFVGGNTKYFYAYTEGNWNKKADAIFGGKDSLKGIKDGAALAEKDGRIYAFKGGNTQIFGYYNPSTNTWNTLETIPKYPKNKKIKAGGALAAHDCRIYALKGGNSKEFWCYVPGTSGLDKVEPSTISQAMTDKTVTTPKFSIDVTPNPFTKLTTIRYTVPVSGKVSLKLYNATGRLIETLLDEHRNAGSYTLKIENWKLKISRGIYFLKYEDMINRADIKFIMQ